MIEATSRGASHLFVLEGEWNEYPPGTAYRCELYLSQERGEFIANSSLPGVSGHGGSEPEALERVQKLAAESIRAYKSAGQAIPWQQRLPRPEEVVRVVVIAV